MTQGEKDANIGQATREYAEALERISQLEIQCAKIGKEMSDLGKFLLEDPEKISIDDNGVRSRGTGGSVISDVILAE